MCGKLPDHLKASCFLIPTWTMQPSVTIFIHMQNNNPNWIELDGRDRLPLAKTTKSPLALWRCNFWHKLSWAVYQVHEMLASVRQLCERELGGKGKKCRVRLYHYSAEGNGKMGSLRDARHSTPSSGLRFLQTTGFSDAWSASIIGFFSIFFSFALHLEACT